MSIKSTIDNLQALLWSSAGTVGGGAVTVSSAKESNFIENVWNIGVLGMFSDWSRQDTYTIVGFILTAFSLYYAREAIKINREKLKLDRSKLSGSTNNSK